MKNCTIFEAIPDGLERTVKVQPFNIKSPQDQWGKSVDGLPQIVKVLMEGFAQRHISATILGGSMGKGTFDELSDIDLGILTQDTQSAASFIERAFGKAEHIEDKKTSISFHYGAGKYGNRRFEIRISPESTLKELREKITKKVPLNQMEQDFLANFVTENVLFANSEMLSLVSDLSYSEEQALYDIRQNIALIRDYGFQNFLERQDFALYFYYMSVCKRAMLNLIYADNRVFHRGYKHEARLKKKLAKFPSGLMRSLDHCFFSPSLTSVEAFLSGFEEYRHSLYRGFGNAVDFQK